MPRLSHTRLRNFSEGLFRRLLVIYPKAHRDEYGPSMNQLFRDQCRDASRADRDWGLIKLWIRVLPDLVRTSVLEHLTAFKEKSMNERMNRLFQSRSAPRTAFIVTLIGVFLVALAASTLVTFMLPETYASVSRIRFATEDGKPVDPNRFMTEFEVLQSDVILDQVVYELNLKSQWGRKFSDGSPLETANAIELLRRRISFRPVRNTQLVEIACYSDSPDEAAGIANAIANAYRNHCLQLGKQAAFAAATNRQPMVAGNSRVEIIDSAAPATEPVRPRKALNIVVGGIVGIVLGLAIGGCIGGLTFILGQKVRKNPV